MFQQLLINQSISLSRKHQWCIVVISNDCSLALLLMVTLYLISINGYVYKWLLTFIIKQFYFTH